MRILLAVDGSDESYEAARALSHLTRAEELILLHAVDVPRPAYPKITPEVAADIYATVSRQMKEEGARLLDQMASVLPLQTGPVTKLLEVGKPAEVILKVAQEKQVDLILLGTRGAGPMKELIVGSVSHRVLGHADCPAFLVTRPVRALRQVLLPVQGEDDAAGAIVFLANKPFREPIEVSVMTAVSFAPPPWPADTAVAEAMKKDVLDSARFFVEDVVERLSKEQVKARGFVALGPPAAVILDEVAKTKPDLILMGSRGRSGLSRFMLGSVSHSVLHRAHCPVLMYPWRGTSS